MEIVCAYEASWLSQQKFRYRKIICIKYENIFKNYNRNDVPSLSLNFDGKQSETTLQIFSYPLHNICNVQGRVPQELSNSQDKRLGDFKL